MFISYHRQHVDELPAGHHVTLFPEVSNVRPDVPEDFKVPPNVWERTQDELDTVGALARCLEGGSQGPYWQTPH